MEDYSAYTDEELIMRIHNDKNDHGDNNEIMDYITFNKIINGKELKQFWEQKRNYSIISINAKASYIPYDKTIYSYKDFI